jgi:predicted short-subunit dehydrogenase-like oxidoreductase (DUF2520 family)
MRITLIGPGRAGTALALAARSAGHDIVAVMARRPEAAASASDLLGAPPLLSMDDDVPACDLAIVATRDAAIRSVAEGLAADADSVGGVVHLSGLAPVDSLAALADRSIPVGSFHPLQTLPTPRAGADRLPGAWIGVTTDSAPLHIELFALAESLGAHPFDLPDESKAVYHAAAAAAANFPLAALAMASDLFEAAGVPFDAAGPLVGAVIANAFELGPRAALTGPVARGDLETVAAQLDAVANDAPEWLDGFRAFVAELARVSGRGDQFSDLTEPGRPSWK